MKKLIIIPAYNEQDCIAGLIRKIKEECPDYDYVILNDGSTDCTDNVCQSNCYNYIHLIANLGIGGAVQCGYKYAKYNNYDIAVQIDGDGQHNPEFVYQLEEELVTKNVNLVIGSRYIEKKGFQSSVYRRFGIKCLSLLIKILTGKVITDCTSGFRMCDRQLIESFASHYPEDYPEPESVVTAIRNGYKVSEIPIIMNERKSGKSSINHIRAAYYMIKVSLAIIVDVTRTREE